MLFNPKHEAGLRRMAGREKTCVASVLANAFAQAERPQRAEDAQRVDQLLDAGAFTDAALVMLEATLPDWHLRRLFCEDAEWHCSLSRQPNLPAEIDDTADACHEILPVAILDALAEAQQKTSRCNARSPVAPRARQLGGYLHCCDNFA
jgi:hypothetical protein